MKIVKENILTKEINLVIIEKPAKGQVEIHRKKTEEGTKVLRRKIKKFRNKENE